METLKSDNIKEIAAHCWWVIQLNPSRVFELYYDREKQLLKFLLQHEPSWYNFHNDPSRYVQIGIYTVNCERWHIEQDIQILRKEIKNVHIPSGLGKKSEEIRDAINKEIRSLEDE